MKFIATNWISDETKIKINTIMDNVKLRMFWTYFPILFYIFRMMYDDWQFPSWFLVQATLKVDTPIFSILLIFCFNLGCNRRIYSTAIVWFRLLFPRYENIHALIFLTTFNNFNVYRRSKVMKYVITYTCTPYTL